MEKEQLHLCEDCALKRKPVSTLIPIDPTDCTVFSRISTMRINTAQALVIPAPAYMSDKERKDYFDSLVASDNNANALLNEWWTMACKKYGVPKHVRFDPELQEFYECVDENGVPSKTDDFVPKTQK